MHARMIKGTFRSHLALGKTGRFRNNVRIESSVFNISTSWPEAGAAHLMRVGFLSNAVGSRTRRGATTRKARYGEIETAPKEVHGAALAHKSSPKLLKDAVNRNQNPPETMRV